MSTTMTVTHAPRGRHRIRRSGRARSRRCSSSAASISTDAIDAVVEYYENDVGPQNGARVVARAWVDPGYRERLLATAARAIAELGYRRRRGRAHGRRREHAARCTT